MSVLRTIGMTLLVVLASTPSGAQPAPEMVARVVQAAAIHGSPDTRRLPIKVAPAGSTLRIVKTEGDWLQVQWDDGKYGVRLGYVQRSLVAIEMPRPAVVVA